MMTNIAGVQDKAGNLVTDLSAREIDEILQAAHEKVGIMGVFEAIDNNTQTTLLLEAA